MPGDSPGRNGGSRDSGMPAGLRNRLAHTGAAANPAAHANAAAAAQVAAIAQQQAAIAQQVAQ